jgi:hypothetical protein
VDVRREIREEWTFAGRSRKVGWTFTWNFDGWFTGELGKEANHSFFAGSPMISPKEAAVRRDPFAAAADQD